MSSSNCLLQRYMVIKRKLRLHSQHQSRLGFRSPRRFHPAKSVNDRSMESCGKEPKGEVFSGISISTNQITTNPLLQHHTVLENEPWLQHELTVEGSNKRSTTLCPSTARVPRYPSFQLAKIESIPFTTPILVQPLCLPKSNLPSDKHLSLFTGARTLTFAFPQS